MTATRQYNAFRAASHFGMGPRPAELAAVSADPRGWLAGQLKATSARLSIASSSERIQTMFDFMRQQRAGSNDARDMRRYYRDTVRPLVADDLRRRLSFAVSTENPFRERLVGFWSNHFTVSHAGKRQLTAACTAYENEAIRPNLDGTFADMLLAVESHPVMLIYLDNHQSVGPSARLPRRRGRGLNENLAREILELHTLGVDGGYDQADVTSLARIITGWTVSTGLLPRRLMSGPIGEFGYVDALHEPGTHELLGRKYGEDGMEQGRRALHDLARHPSTARFIATKLVRHFVADDPPEKAIAAIETAFTSSGGHLPTVHRALIDLDAAWDADNKKLRTPYELLVATARGLDPPSNFLRGGFSRMLQLMNHVPFGAKSPAGWPDDAGHWGSPSALKARVEFGLQIGERLGGRRDVRRAAEFMVASQDVRDAVDRADSPAQGLGLLLASPAFQWRV